MRGTLGIKVHIGTICSEMVPIRELKYRLSQSYGAAGRKRHPESGTVVRMNNTNPPVPLSQAPTMLYGLVVPCNNRYLMHHKLPNTLPVFACGDTHPVER